jgi:hypothetical protein
MKRSAASAGKKATGFCGVAPEAGDAGYRDAISALSFDLPPSAISIAAAAYRTQIHMVCFPTPTISVLISLLYETMLPGRNRRFPADRSDVADFSTCCRFDCGYAQPLSCQRKISLND